MRFFFTMFYNCTKFQNNPRGSVEKHPKICWIDMEWPIGNWECAKKYHGIIIFQDQPHLFCIHVYFV